nr:hypothetical protein [Paracoccaceae bacterium]
GVVVWSWFDWNDNHYARQQEIPLARVAELAGVSVGEAESAKLPGDTDVRQAFRDWLDSRADRQAYIDAGKPYPVYMVAAQGGGLYAAYQSALFLSRIQDACPNFAPHIFGLSGVSGGAVGTTVFTSLAMRYALNREPQDLEANPCGATSLGQENSLESKARDILSQDFLSPLVAAMLFPDFTARFSPTPIPPFDRARALEGAFEHAWRRTGDARVSPLTEGLMTYWRPGGAAPALFVNTTEAGNGLRMILSPIHDLGPELRSYAKEAARPGDVEATDYGLLSVPQYREANNNTPYDMPLSTAMILSARFPYITPAGSLDLMQEIDRDQPKQRVKTRLVDGGYFENSGIATAVDVIRQLEEDLENLNVDLRLIVFDLTQDQYREPNHSLGELLSPIQAILSARSSRAALAQGAARRDFTNAFYQSNCRYLLQGGLVPWDADEACPPSQLKRSRIWSVSLNDFEFDFQLGWILSQETLSRIDRQLGSPDECRVSTRAINGAEMMSPEEDMAREQERAAAAQTRYGDGSVLREVAAIELTRDERAVERHNSCVARFITDQLMRR